VFDLDHRFTYANEVLLRMWGKTWDQAIGRTCLELGYEPWHAAMHDEEIERVKATGQPIRGEVPFNGAFGRRIYDYIFVPVFGPDGKVEAIAGTTRDVTERKQAEEEAQRLAAHLAEANRRKTEFLATLAHELRNPLAPIRTALDLMRLSNHAPAAAERAHGMMDRQLNQLVHLIDDLMDLSRIDSGKIELKKERVSLQAVLASAVEAVLPAVEAASHTLDMDIPSDPVWLEADSTRLSQVLSNLLTNAVKYTPNGGKLALFVTAQDSTVSIGVRDNGVGIPPDGLPHVFEMFSQVARHSSRSQGGLGIGLALVRSLVELHGGTVGVHSDGEGRGSTFTISLPRASVPHTVAGSAAAPDAPANAANRRRILLADDNLDAAATLGELFAALGHDVALAHDGPGAIELARAGDYDLVVLDIGMPGMSGYEVIGRLRVLPHLAATRFVALTGWGNPNDREQARAAGFHDHLTKPAGLAELSRLLDSSKHIDPLIPGAQDNSYQSR
jgi:PAS domain S-box-containing protein